MIRHGRKWPDEVSVAVTVQIELAPALAERAGGAGTVTLDAGNVGEALEGLAVAHPGLSPLLWREPGRLNPFLVIFHNEKDIRGETGLKTALAAGDTLALVTALEGGSSALRPRSARLGESATPGPDRRPVFPP